MLLKACTRTVLYNFGSAQTTVLKSADSLQPALKELCCCFAHQAVLNCFDLSLPIAAAAAAQKSKRAVATAQKHNIIAYYYASRVTPIRIIAHQD
jgi:hypothetical protein